MSSPTNEVFLVKLRTLKQAFDEGLVDAVEWAGAKRDALQAFVRADTRVTTEGPAAGNKNSAKDAETELIGNACSAGKAIGHPEEAFAKNPWSFKADKTFVTLRDGCHGSWSCRVDRDTVTLRMEWQDGQHGNWAEFSRQLGSLSSTFRSVGSSYDFMRSWSIEVGPMPAQRELQAAQMLHSQPMVLTKRGSANQCVFNDIAELKVGGEISLTLSGRRGIGRKYPEERRAGSWRYTESGCGPAEAAIRVRFEDGQYIKLADADLVLDVAYWKMEEGNTVNFVGGTPGFRGTGTRTKTGGGGRDWTINDDGTISAKHHPHLVLGVRGTSLV